MFILVPAPVAHLLVETFKEKISIAEWVSTSEDITEDMLLAAAANPHRMFIVCEINNNLLAGLLDAPLMPGDIHIEVKPGDNLNDLLNQAASLKPHFKPSQKP